MSGALDRFRRLPPDVQDGFVERVRAQLCDEPDGFAGMEEIVDEREQNSRDRPLPGGTTLGERLDAEARRRAGYVDDPSYKQRLVESRSSAVIDPLGPQADSGFVPPYPWMAT